MPHEKTHDAHRHLCPRDAHSQPVLLHRPEPDEPQIEQGEVRRLGDRSFVILPDRDQGYGQTGKQLQRAGHDPAGRMLPFRHRRFQEPGPGIEVRQAVPRAGHDAEELGARVEEVEDLRDEGEEQGFAEVAEDADDGEDHTGEVAVRVADEDPGGVPVVPPERRGDADEGEEEVNGEEVGVCCWMRARRRWRGVERQEVVEEEEDGDDDGLRDFDAVDAGEDVDAVGAEDGDAGHVGVVDPTKIDQVAEVGFELDWDDYVGDAVVDEVDDEHRDGGKSWNEEFVPPADVEKIVGDAEDDDGLEGEKSGKVGC